MNNIQFTPKDILEKSFSQKMRGYDPNEVDTFLDGIIKDYQAFDNRINSLENENNQLRMEVQRLKQSAGTVTPGPSVSPSGYFNDSNSAPSNHDNLGGSRIENELLKRVSNLEQRVFGSTEGPSSIDRY
ncbi:cell division regulator GpsB [Apilactobacillus zhangqiuensis]|uniref:cell division regulator GpsB n=1 Tax=Apilactobacillus zhangqiuensis TaxID=2841031 RepID=UPI0006CEAAD1|nr:cell division regulator GpsB [Apilactobacillus zhangqiuensis]KPN79639.1 Cell cycle protein GpsB [Apilactobacillus kunkeei]WKN28635.1 cell division regulator GpsB [Apilactobacillus kunkeei]